MKNPSPLLWSMSTCRAHATIASLATGCRRLCESGDFDADADADDDAGDGAGDDAVASAASIALMSRKGCAQVPSVCTRARAAASCSRSTVCRKDSSFTSCSARARSPADCSDSSRCAARACASSASREASARCAAGGHHRGQLLEENKGLRKQKATTLRTTLCGLRSVGA